MSLRDHITSLEAQAPSRPLEADLEFHNPYFDFLAQQSEEWLEEQLRLIEQNISRARAMAYPIEEEMLRRGTAQNGNVSRRHVFELISSHGQPVTATDVHQLVEQHGVEMSVNAVRVALSRLTNDDGLLSKQNEYYVVR